MSIPELHHSFCGSHSADPEDGGELSQWDDLADVFGDEDSERWEDWDSPVLGNGDDDNALVISLPIPRTIFVAVFVCSLYLCSVFCNSTSVHH